MSSALTNYKTFKENGEITINENTAKKIWKLLETLSESNSKLFTFRTTEIQAFGCNVKGYDIIFVRFGILKPVRALI